MAADSAPPVGAPPALRIGTGIDVHACGCCSPFSSANDKGTMSRRLAPLKLG